MKKLWDYISNKKDKNRNKVYYKSFFKILGLIITFFSFIFIIDKIIKLKIKLVKLIKLDYYFYFTFLFGIILYFFIFILVVINWIIIVKFLKHNNKNSNWNLNFFKILSIYGKTFIGKYIPGNIGHFIGRHLLFEELKCNHIQIGISNLLEVFFSIFNSFIIVVILNIAFNFFSIYKEKSSLSSNFIYKISILLFFSIILTLFFIISYIKKRNNIKKSQFNLKKIFYSGIKVSLIWIFIYVFHFIIINFIIYYIIKQNIDLKSQFFILSSFIIAWIGGFITPGSPGGIGVREALFLFFTSSQISSEIALSIILIHRLINILGDIFIFFISIIIEKYLIKGEIDEKRGK